MTFVAVLASLLATTAHAGKSPLEKVRDLCPGLNLQQRPVVAVAPFEATVPAPDAVRDTTAALLTGGLLGSGCFSVAEEGARYQVTGRTIEFSETVRDAGIVVNGEAMTAFRVRLGLILELKDTETGELVASQSFAVSEKSRELASKQQGGVSKALAGAMEQLSADVVKYLAPYRPRLATKADG